MFNENRTSLTNEYGDELIMTGWSLKGAVQGMAFEATLEQKFVNSTGDHAEIVYNFPLPWGAELLGLEAQVGDKCLTGAVIGKKESEAKYEEALSEGDSAILLERNADYDYTLNLGGIKSGEKVVITVRYGQLLRFSKSGLRLSIPTVIAPRFGDPIQDGGLKQHQVSGTSGLAEYPFTLEVALHGDWAHAGIESPSHSIKVGQVEQGIRKITLSKVSYLDRDFVLTLEKSEAGSLAVVVPDYAEPDSSMVLAAFKPDFSGDDSKPVNVKILVDCSGSMAGDSIEAARRSLQAFVGELTERDHFSLSKFGSLFMHRSKGLWKATDPAKLAAQRWIATLNADMGGTRMGPALMDTFDLASQEPADVLLVTDGDIHAIDHVIKLAKESKHRLFIVGIGSAPSESNLRRMAEETLGACDFVGPGEDVGPAVTNMFARLRTSAIRELKISWPNSMVPSWVSAMEQVAYDGDTVYAFAKFRGQVTGEIALSGKKDDGSVVTVGAVAFPLQKLLHPDLSRLAMAGDIERLISREGGHAGNGQKLAEEYQLVTDRTNLFMLIDRADKKSDVMPELHKVDQMVPAGFGGLGTANNLSVRSSRERFTVIEPLRASPVSRSDPFGDFAQYDLPPGMRSARYSMGASSSKFKLEAFVSQGADHYDIPAFLRKDAADQVKEPKPMVWSLDVDDGRLYLDTIEYEGLTPLGLFEWVRHTVEADWPTTYRGLIKIGVPIMVVDWLELLLAVEAGANEPVAVASFLHAFSSQSVSMVLADVIDDFAKGQVGKDQFVVTHDPNPISVDALVYADTLKAMERVVNGAWPVCIFDMELA